MLKKKMKTTAQKQSIAAYLCITPALLGFFLLTLIPLIAVIYMSLTNWTLLADSKFIGFDNYVNLFSKDLFFKKSFLVTVYYAVGTVVGTLVYGFLLALFLNRPMPGRAAFRTIYYLPSIVPAIVNSVLWMWVYDPDFGLFNLILKPLGIKSMWLFSERTSVPSLIIMAMWASGNIMIIFLAGLQDVPKAYLEAVEIDGGNFWHKFRHVTLPMMTPVIFFNFLMGVIRDLQVFTPAYVMTNGGPNNSTLFMVYFIYREAFQNNNMGYACAISFFFFIVVAILTVIVFKSSNSWVFYEGGDDK